MISLPELYKSMAGDARLQLRIAAQIRSREGREAQNVPGNGCQDDVNNSERAASVMRETAGCLMRRSAEMA